MIKDVRFELDFFYAFSQTSKFGLTVARNNSTFTVFQSSCCVFWELQLGMWFMHDLP